MAGGYRTGRSVTRTATATLSVTIAAPPAPRVLSVTPLSGTKKGGTTVTGTSLYGTTAVNFGSVPGTAVTVNAAGTRLTVVSPPEAPGTVDVTVTTPWGTSAVSAADQYKFTRR